METIAEQAYGQGGQGGQSQGSSAPGRQCATEQRPGGTNPLPPLPRQGDIFTEDQLRERFGPLSSGGIRTSATSTDIVVVRNVHSNYNDVEHGKRIDYDGTYVAERPDQMVGGNQRLAESAKGGNRILYFTKEVDRLRFEGLFKCVRQYDKEDSSRPGAVAFELERVDDGGGPQDARTGRRDVSPSPRGAPAPDLDMIMSVERAISGHRYFAGRYELLSTLPAGIDPATLDRILAYLEGSAKISTDGGSIRWTFSGAGRQRGPGRGAAPTAEELAYILSMEERLSADLDNDLPYSEETEQAIADCKEGRLAGRTYMGEEYLRHLNQEHGAVDLEYTRE